VPWFVAWFDGKPDFRVVDHVKLVRAVKERRCMICGGVLGRYLAFAIGPMCAINRVSSEPPSHTDCATFAAKVCPFLANPSKPRRETDLPENDGMAGEGLKRNPGVVLVWVTKHYAPFRAPGGAGVLFQIGPAEEWFWFAQGREATRAEVQASIDSGLPILKEAAKVDGAEAALELAAASALRYLPKE